MYFIDIAACSYDREPFVLNHDRWRLDPADKVVLQDIDMKPISQGTCGLQERNMAGMKEIRYHSGVNDTGGCT
jgi:hypothetical protein